MGVLLGWVTARTGSVLPAIAAHACVNTIAITLVNSPGFGTGRGGPETLPWPAVLVWGLLSVTAFAALSRLESRRPPEDAPRPPP
jgi:hypothetical protein